MMNLDELLQSYLSLTQNSICVSRVSVQEQRASLVYLNPAYQTMFGVDAKSEIGQTPLKSVDPAFHAHVDGLFEHALAAKQSSIQFESRFIRPDGGAFWASVSVIFVPAENDDMFMISTHQDITDIKQRETAAESARKERDRLFEDLKAAQERLSSALDSYPDPFVIFDKGLNVITCNTAYQSAMATDPNDIQPGMNFSDILAISMRDKKIVPDNRDEAAFIAAATDPKNFDTPVMDLALPDDTHFRVLRSRTANGDLVAIRLNTTEMVRERRAAEHSRARLLAAIEAYPAPFAIFSETLDLVVCNEPYAATFSDNREDVPAGIPLEALLWMALRRKRVKVPLGQEQAWVDRILSVDVDKDPIEDIEDPDGNTYRVMRSRAKNGDIIVVRQDTTAMVNQRRAVEEYAQKLEIANDAILHEALHDQLTGLGNRRYLTEQFRELSRKRRDSGGEIAALHIDLDRFKQINDTMGHAAGDCVLIDTADRIRANLSSRDIVARIGGDEFIVLLYMRDDFDRPLDLAVDLLRDLSKPSFWEGKECRFGASIGIAATPLASEDELLIDSDLALYKAKRGGRNQVGVFDRADKEDMKRLKALADDVLRGLENAEFIPYYHPQVDAKSGQIVGLEALARWRHPTKGILDPGFFIGVATDLNILSDIDRMIFDHAIDECTRVFATEPDPPSLSFNVSFRSVLSPDTRHIGQRAQQYPGEVALELLETIFLEEASTEFLMQIDRFRDMGLTIEVDDFGSGRASVVALQRIAPDRLKIDRQLVAPLEQSDGAGRLVQSIVEIGHALGIGVTAEGVETQAQARILAGFGCDRLQGFLYGPPSPSPSVLEKMQTSPISAKPKG